MMSIRARLREREMKARKYPRCWKRVSRIIRALAHERCERCGQHCDNLSVHHIGAPYIDGTPGNKTDKHDIRRENLAALCYTCHCELDGVDLGAVRRKYKKRKAKRRNKLETHRALGIGTGLVVVRN
jgi:ribosomal protein L34E